MSTAKGERGKGGRTPSVPGLSGYTHNATHDNHGHCYFRLVTVAFLLSNQTLKRRVARREVTPHPVRAQREVETQRTDGCDHPKTGANRPLEPTGARGMSGVYESDRLHPRSDRDTQLGSERRHAPAIEAVPVIAAQAVRSAQPEQFRQGNAARG